MGMVLLFCLSCHKPHLKETNEVVNDVPLTRGQYPGKALNGYLFFSVGSAFSFGHNFNAMAVFYDPAVNPRRRFFVHQNLPWLENPNLSMGMLYLMDMPLDNQGGANYQFTRLVKNDSLLLDTVAPSWKVPGNIQFPGFEASFSAPPSIYIQNLTPTVTVAYDYRLSCAKLSDDYDSLTVMISGYGGGAERRVGSRDSVMVFSRHELQPIRQYSSSGQMMVYAARYYYMIRGGKKYAFEVGRAKSKDIHFK